MSCVAKFCKNRCNQVKKSSGVTYHRFPTNEVMRNAWIKIIRVNNGENDWLPSEQCRLCCAHFEANDLYTTKKGRQRVVKYAVPKKFLFEPVNVVKEKPADVHYISKTALEQPCVTMIGELSIKQERASVNVPAFEQAYVTMAEEPNEFNVKQERASVNVSAFEQAYVTMTEEPNEFNVKQENASVTVPAFKQAYITMTEETNVFSVNQERTPSVTVPAFRQACVTMTAEPNTIFSAKQEGASANVPKYEQPCVAMTGESNTLSATIQDNTSGTGGISEDLLSVGYREQILKQSLVKHQIIMKKQKRHIKTLKQKVKRLQNRNKSLKDIIKFLKDNN